MLALFFDTGMRLMEVITLRAEQIREDINKLIWLMNTASRILEK